MKLKKKGVIIISCLLVVSILLSVFISEKIWDMRLRKAVEKVSKMPILTPFLTNNQDGTISFLNRRDASKYFVYNIADNKITTHSRENNQMLNIEHMMRQGSVYISGDYKFSITETELIKENIKTGEKVVVFSTVSGDALVYRYKTGNALMRCMYWDGTHLVFSEDSQSFISVYNADADTIVTHDKTSLFFPLVYTYNQKLYFVFKDGIKHYDFNEKAFIPVVNFGGTLEKATVLDFVVNDEGLFLITQDYSNGDICNLYSFDGELINSRETNRFVFNSAAAEGKNIYMVVKIDDKTVLQKFSENLTQSEIICDNLINDKWNKDDPDIANLTVYDSKVYYTLYSSWHNNDAVEVCTIENGKAKGIYYEKPNILRKLVKRTCK